MDLWLVKTENMGTLEWEQNYGGSESDNAWSLRQTSNGNFVIAGRTKSFGSESMDLWLIKLGPLDTIGPISDGFLDFGRLEGLVAMSIIVFSYIKRRNRSNIRN